jgi:hypothetical protein
MMTMSALSAQNFGVTPSNTSAVSAKKHAKHGEPAAVAAQPRDAAPDTFESQKTDVTSTTTATTPEATNSGAFPAVAVAGGAVAGAGIGFGATQFTPLGDDSENVKKEVTFKTDKGQPIAKDKVTFDADKKLATFDGLTYAVEVDKDGIPTKLGDVTGTIKPGNKEYTYNGKTASIELTPPANAPDYYPTLLGDKAHADQKATLYLLDDAKLQIKPHDNAGLEALEFSLDANKKLVASDAVQKLVTDKKLEQATLDAFVKELTDTFNAPKALEELGTTNKKLVTSLDELFENTTKETKGKSGLVIAGATLLLGLAGAAAGFFLGKKKEDPAATTITANTTTQTAAPTA